MTLPTATRKGGEHATWRRSGGHDGTEQPTRIRWLMIGMIFVVDVLMFIDRVNISIAAKYIIPEYGLTEVQMGSVFSAFVLGYALLQIPGGWLGDRFGPRRVLAVAIFWWSAFTAVTAIAGELFLVSLFGIVGSFIVVRVDRCRRSCRVTESQSPGSKLDSATRTRAGDRHWWKREYARRRPYAAPDCRHYANTWLACRLLSGGCSRHWARRGVVLAGTRPP